MKTLKKTIAFVIIACMLLSFAACGEKGPDVTGKYICVSESYSKDESNPPTSESWIELKKGGKGTYYSGFEFNLKWKLDGENFTATVTFLGMTQSIEGTLKDGLMDVKFEDVYMRLVKEGMEAPATNAPAGTPGSGESTAAELPEVADSLFDALGVDPDTYDGSVEVLTGEWYGWIRESNCQGGHPESFQAAWAFININADNRKYFEIFKDGDSDNAFLSMWIETEDTDRALIPEIGDKDAWIIDTYLYPEDSPYLETYIGSDGSLSFTFSYVSYDGSRKCTVDVFLRKDGVLWNEDYDTLPPNYDEYKAAVAANQPFGN